MYFPPAQPSPQAQKKASPPVVSYIPVGQLGPDTATATGRGVGLPAATGRGVGRGVGRWVGRRVGRWVGRRVGLAVGRGVDTATGRGVGRRVGAGADLVQSPPQMFS